METEILKVNNLKTYFFFKNNVIIKAVDGLDFSVSEGETLGIVGESGCGKSMTAFSIMGLTPPPGKVFEGEIIFEGQDLTKLANKEMRKIRGKSVSMIFQEPMTSLNPVFTIGHQVFEAIAYHQNSDKKDIVKKSIEMLKSVGMPTPEERYKNYPHQLSGGMRQRVMIAMAMACKPKLMIADEPTTALDVTIQAQILDLMLRLKEEAGTSIILITHDLGVIAENAQNVMVMYTGKVMEYANVLDLFGDPKHPYTIALMKSIPRLDDLSKTGNQLDVIEGTVPSLLNLPKGCKFSNRCEKSMNRCLNEDPPLIEIEANHLCRCWLYT